MTSLSAVNNFNVLKHSVTCLLPGLIAILSGPFVFQTKEKAFNINIVKTHAPDNIMPGQ